MARKYMKHMLVYGQVDLQVSLQTAWIIGVLKDRTNVSKPGYERIRIFLEPVCTKAARPHHLSNYGYFMAFFIDTCTRVIY